MDLRTKIEYESEVAPGVKYTIRVLNQIERARRDLQMRQSRLAARAAWEKVIELGRQIWGAEESPARREELLRGHALANELASTTEFFQLITDADIMPAVVRAGVVSISGLSFDGQPATVDTLIASGDAQLLKEISNRCDDACGLSADQRKN